MAGQEGGDLREHEQYGPRDGGGGQYDVQTDWDTALDSLAHLKRSHSKSRFSQQPNKLEIKIGGVLKSEIRNQRPTTFIL